MANTTDPLARSIHGTNPQVWRTRERHSFGPLRSRARFLNQPLSHLENVIEIGYAVLTVPDSLISVHFRRASLLAESLGKDYGGRKIYDTAFWKVKSLSRTQRSCIQRFDSRIIFAARHSTVDMPGLHLGVS